MKERLPMERMREIARDLPLFITTIDAMIEDRKGNWPQVAAGAGDMSRHRLWRYMRQSRKQAMLDFLEPPEYLDLFATLTAEPAPRLTVETFRPDRKFAVGKLLGKRKPRLPAEVRENPEILQID